MKCSDCGKLINESFIIDNIECFVCSSCGNCIEIDLAPKTLSLGIIYRVSSDSTHESYSSNFIVDGVSLIDTLSKSYGASFDFLGCFARDWSKLNEHSKRQLLLLDAPEMDSGRRLLYVCPECADIGCGAFCGKIRKEGCFYIWEDFAYENGYEEPQVIPDVGPFRFRISEYEYVIDCAYNL